MSASNEESVVTALDAVQADWEAAIADPRRMTQLPPGSYLFKIINAFVGRSTGEAHRLQLRIDIQVLRAPNEKDIGRNYFKTWGLDAEGLRWLAGDLMNLGFELPRESTKIATELCPMLINTCFESQVRPSRTPEYGPNVWIPKNARRTPEGDLALGANGSGGLKY